MKSKINKAQQNCNINYVKTDMIQLMHKPEFSPEYETYEIPWNFEIEMNHLIQARTNVKKKNLSSGGFWYSCWPQSRNERKLRLTNTESWNALENEGDGLVNNRWNSRNGSQDLGKETG